MAAGPSGHPAAHMRDVPNDVHAVGVGRDDEH